MGSFGFNLSSWFIGECPLYVHHVLRISSRNNWNSVAHHWPPNHWWVSYSYFYILWYFIFSFILFFFCEFLLVYLNIFLISHHLYIQSKSIENIIESWYLESQGKRGYGNFIFEVELFIRNLLRGIKIVIKILFVKL